MSQTHRVDSRRRHLAGLDVDETPAMIQADLRNAYGAILQVEGARSCGAVLLELCATGCRAAAARRSADVATMRSRVDQRQDQQRTGACHVCLDLVAAFREAELYGDVRVGALLMTRT